MQTNVNIGLTPIAVQPQQAAQPAAARTSTQALMNAQLAAVGYSPHSAMESAHGSKEKRRRDAMVGLKTTTANTAVVIAAQKAGSAKKA